MPSLKCKIRKFLWRLLGIDYNQILKTVDNVYLKNDPFSTLGIGTYDNNAIVYRWSDAPLIVGKYCSIANGVKFIVDDGSHCFNIVSSYPFKTNMISEKKGIIVGNDVWIGMNSIILNGVSVGNGVTIAAGSVVTKDVPDYCVIGGVPAKIISRKCSEDDAKKMVKIAWWDWEKEIIDYYIDDFKLSIEDFIKIHRDDR